MESAAITANMAAIAMHNGTKMSQLRCNCSQIGQPNEVIWRQSQQRNCCTKYKSGKMMGLSAITAKWVGTTAIAAIAVHNDTEVTGNTHANKKWAPVAAFPPDSAGILRFSCCFDATSTSRNQLHESNTPGMRKGLYIFVRGGVIAIAYCTY